MKGGKKKKEGKKRASLVAQRLKHLPAMQQTWVQSLSREDPLEKEMATQSSILAWRISWTEEPGGLQSMGHSSTPQVPSRDEGEEKAAHRTL